MPADREAGAGQGVHGEGQEPEDGTSTSTSTTSPGHAAIAIAVQAFWKELGITTKIKSRSSAAVPRVPRPAAEPDVDVYRLGWIYDFPDAINGLELWTCDSGNNNTNWCNKEYDALVEEGGNGRRTTTLATSSTSRRRRSSPARTARCRSCRSTGTRPRPWSSRTCRDTRPTSLDQIDFTKVSLTLGEVDRRRVRAGRDQRPARTLSESRAPPVDAEVLARCSSSSVRRDRLDDPGAPARHLHDVRDDAADRGQPVPDTERAVPESIQRNLERKFNLDKPWYVQYLYYVKGVVHARPRPVARAAQPDGERHRQGALPALDQARPARVALRDRRRDAARDDRGAQAEHGLRLRGDVLREHRLRGPELPRRDAAHLLLRARQGLHGLTDERVGRPGST